MSSSIGLPWPQITLRVDNAHADVIESSLLRAGALSTTFLDVNNEPVLEPAPGEVRLWKNMLLVALFDQSRSKEELINCVCHELGVDSLSLDAFELVEDRQWERAWMDQYRPMKFGSRLWIYPTHLEPIDVADVNLRLDPGLAFGTGTHATTALCLEWFDTITFENKSVIDYGCGSGVLAIAALLLGAQEVRATDIDPLAIQASQDNARINNVHDRLQLLSAKELEGCISDILVANILFQPLLDLRNHFASLVVDGGIIVLSGILENQVEELKTEYANNFDIGEVALKDGWARICGKRKVR